MYDSIDINEIDQIHITSLNTHDSNQRILILEINMNIF